MKKIFTLIALSIVFVVPAVYAQDGIGVGWDSGYSIKVPVNPVCIQVTGQFDSVVPEDDDIDTETDVEIAAYVSYPYVIRNNSRLSMFGGFGLLPTTRSTTAGTRSYDKELDFLLRFGVQPEAMITDNIGVSAKLGLELEFDRGYDGLDDSGETDVSAWGRVGVHWYFQ